MAGYGNTVPKDPAKRRRRNKDSKPTSKVAVDGVLRGHPLPEVEGVVWHPRTVAWWEHWRRSPQASAFIDTDWDFLLDTALIHHTMWSNGRWEYASELRLRAAKLGATHEDRLRLRIEIQQPDSTAAAPTAVADTVTGGGASVTDINSRRARLGAG